MTKLCEGRVAIITGAGRGIGREHALLLAHHGAKIVVNDLGGSMDGEGNDQGPAQDVVDEIKAIGRRGHREHRRHQRLGWRRAPRAVGGRHLRRARRAHQQRRHPPGPHAHQHERGGVGRGDQGAPEGHLRPGAARRRVLARALEGRRDQRRPHHQHVVAVGHLRQRRADQLRRRQGRHRQLHDHRRQGARSLRRHRERHRARGAHPDDRGPRDGQRPRGDQGADVAGAHRPDRLLAGEPGGGPRHRPGLRRHRPDAVRQRRAGTGARPSRTRPTTWPSSVRRCRSWSPRPAPTPTCRASTKPETRKERTMPINPDAVGTKSEPARRKWTSKDALIYALGVGAGAADPLDELAFTTENTNDVAQRALPTIAVVLGPLGGGMGSIGTFNPAMLVHGEQGITLHQEIPVEGELEAVERDHRDLRQGQGRGRGVREHVDPGQHRRAAVLDPHVGLHPRRGRLGRRPRSVRHAQPGARARARPHRHRADPHRPGAALPAVRATATRSTPTRRSPPWAASTVRSCTACAPTASPVGRSCTRCAAAIRPASRAWTPASRPR